MMRKAISLAVFVILSVVLVGCAMGAPAPLAPEEMERGFDKGLQVAPEAPPPMPAATPAPYGGAEDLVSDRMIVRTASLSLVVEDTEESLEVIENLASELRGYISDLRTWRVNDQLAASVTLRIPAESFDEARERIKDLATELENENVSGQDVTEEYVDLEARLHNLEVAEEELLELLASAQETHRDADSILAIYREITNVRQQIEQIRGRMQYLENVSSLATLTINLTPEEVEEPVVEPGWEPLRQARDALRTLVNALKVLVDLLIWVVLFFLPMVAILSLPFVLAWLGWYAWRRRRRGSKES
ncbi:MAG: hypothetical protein CEE40_02080 [Chloroflexi bacterium B3_Chlor]|nr:MAG: hypothetical protein CEE40_02080 [Chloroflexi bacterium B3_Chlor]